MPWARLSDTAMNHPKVDSLSNAAFRVWIWGLCYCQQGLTDGLITSKAALTACVAADCVTSEAQVAAIDELLAARLWERQRGAGLGYRVHDYLDWNESRERIKKKRVAANARLRKHRSDGDETRFTAPREQGVSVSSETRAHTPCGVGVDQKVLSTTYNARGTKDMGDVKDRAYAFVERYRCELYPTHRRVPYTRTRLVEESDFDSAVNLCIAYTDEQVDQLAAFFLQIPNDSERFVRNKTRTISMLLSMAAPIAERLFAKRVTA